MEETGSYELRNVDINPSEPLPEIDVILVTGQQNRVTKATCDRFATMFDFCHLSVVDYLQALLDAGDAGRHALGTLHPDALKVMTRTSKQVSAVLLIPILYFKIDAEVSKGRKRFLLRGLGEDLEAVLKFMETVSIDIT